jgi:hypothetical protein
VAGCATAGLRQRLAARDVFRRRLFLELGMGTANGERSAQKQASENRPHVVPAPIGPFRRYSPKRGAWRRHAISPQGRPATQNEKGQRYSRHEVAIFESAALWPRFVVRGAENPT